MHFYNARHIKISGRKAELKSFHWRGEMNNKNKSIALLTHHFFGLLERRKQRVRVLSKTSSAVSNVSKMLYIESLRGAFTSRLAMFYLQTNRMSVMRSKLTSLTLAGFLFEFCASLRFHWYHFCVARAF